MNDIEKKYSAEILLGGVDWLVFKVTDNDVTLFSKKSVMAGTTLKVFDGFKATAEFENGNIDEYLNGKFVKTLEKKGVLPENLVGRLTIFSYEEYSSLQKANLYIPPIPEERWWLRSRAVDTNDKSVINYMLQVDNDGNVKKECGACQAGVRAVMTIKKEALSPLQRNLIENSFAVIDERTKKSKPETVSNLKKYQLYQGYKIRALSFIEYHLCFGLSESFTQYDSLKELLNKKEPFENIELQDLTSKYLYIRVRSKIPSIAIEEKAHYIKKKIAKTLQMSCRSVFNYDDVYSTQAISREERQELFNTK